MHGLKSLRRYAFAAVVLSLGISAACLFFPRETSPASRPREDASWEQSQEDAVRTQQEFESLTSQLFLDEAASSLITLHYTLADPQSMGISDYPRVFEPFSLETSRQASLAVHQLLQTLESINRSQLLPDQQLTYDILTEYLKAQDLARGLELYQQPLSSSLGIQAQLPILLAEYAFYSPQDVEDYLSLLSSIESYYQDILAFEREKSQAGLGLADWAIDRIVESCSAYLLEGEHNFLAQTFARRLDDLTGLTQEEKDAYIARNLQAIEDHFLPACRLLSQGLLELKGTGVNQGGLCHFPQGKAYYQYLVRSATGTSLGTVEELASAIESQMAWELQSMSRLLQADPSLAQEVDSAAFRLTDPNAIMEDLKAQCALDFPPVDQCFYQIRQVPQALEGVLSPAFYLTVPLDRPQDNCIYINWGSVDQASLYPTLAHEGYPGHMYQTQYFNSSSACSLRKLLSFTSYTEGWATYVEYYSYGLDNGLSPELGQLLQHNSSFALALYAILDINIHYYGWSMEQMEAYLNRYFQIQDASVIASIYYDVVENPVNYLEYYTGYLEIFQMRQEAVSRLGSRYRDLDFHTFLLEIGPAPFTVIRPRFQAWLNQVTV